MLALPVLLFGFAAQADETFPTNPDIVYPLNGTTLEGTTTKPLAGFDISFVDNDAGVYTLSDSSNAAVDILDLNDARTTGVTLEVVQPQAGSCTLPAGSTLTCNFQGFVADPNATTVGFDDVSGPTGNMTVNHSQIWAADAPVFNGPIQKGSYANDECNASVKVVQLRTQKVTDVINLGGCFRADEMAFDPVDQVALVANPSETDTAASLPPGYVGVNFITLISTKPGHQILARIKFDGTNGTPNAVQGIEQARWNSFNGLFYIAIPADGNNLSGAISIIDPLHLRAVGKFELQHNCNPSGMFIGPDQQAVLGCGNGPVQVVDLQNGHLKGLFPQVGQAPGCDEVWYDRGANHYLVACGPSTGPAAWVAGVIDAGSNGYPMKWDANITTQNLTDTVRGASHSIAADNFTNRILVPMGTGNSLCGSATGCVAAWFTPVDKDDAPPSQ